MRRDNINYLAVGVFVIAVGAALLVTLYKITGRAGPTDTYHVYYDNVAGIKYGTGVYYEGFQVGQVEAVVPEAGADGLRFRVEFSVRQGWRVPEDSVARVVASGLLSAVTIDIAEGASASVLAPGSEVRGRGQANLFAAINKAASHFQELSESDIRPLLQNLNRRITELAEEYTQLSRAGVRPLVASLQERVDDPELIGRLRSTLARLDDAAAGLQQILGEDNRAQLAEILSNANAASAGLRTLVLRIEDTRVKMHGVLVELDTLVQGNKAALGETVGDVRAAAARLRSSLGVLDENIDTVMYHLQGSARNMHEFTRQIRENPGLLLGSSPQPEREGE